MNSLSLRNVGFGLLFSHILQNAQRNNVAKRERGDPSPQKGGGRGGWEGERLLRGCASSFFRRNSIVGNYKLMNVYPAEGNSAIPARYNDRFRSFYRFDDHRRASATHGSISSRSREYQAFDEETRYH